MTAVNERIRRVGKESRKGRARGTNPALCTITPLNLVSHSRSPPCLSPEISLDSEAILQEWRTLSPPELMARVAAPSLWGSRRSERVSPTKRPPGPRSPPEPQQLGVGGFRPRPHLPGQAARRSGRPRPRRAERLQGPAERPANALKQSTRERRAQTAEYHPAHRSARDQPAWAATDAPLTSLPAPPRVRLR